MSFSIGSAVVAVGHQAPVLNERPTMNSITELRRRILEGSQISPVDLSQKITWLNDLSTSITKLRQDCDTFTQEIDAKFAARPWWHAVKICDKLGLHFLCGQLGKERQAVHRATSDINACITKITQRELLALSKIKEFTPQSSMNCVQLYEKIGKLDPSSTLHLEGLADCYYAQKAFAVSRAHYATFLRAHPTRHDVKVKEIQAMVSGGDFTQALAEIEEAKIGLFPVENVKNKPTRSVLDSLKADCLLELKRYPEARSHLLMLLQQEPTNDDVKRKLFLVGFGEALVENQVDDESFFAYAKKMFGQLPRYTQGTTSWTKDCFISDFEFWVFLACSKKISEDKKMHALVLQRISQFVKQPIVSQKALLESITARVDVIKRDADGFLAKYHRFADDTSGAIPDITMPLVAARKIELKEAFFGADRLNSLAGLQHNVDAFSAIVKECHDSGRFNDAEQQTALQKITDLLSQTKNAIGITVNSLISTAINGSHPHINKDALPFIAPLLINAQ
ncbi:MAG: hypothetical protein LLF94_07055 [Chlamydiales bacterium]|nr:hypothetical protein [Chlamydiales bacterium]